MARLRECSAHSGNFFAMFDAAHSGYAWKASTPHLYHVEATTIDGSVRTSCVQLFNQFTPSAPLHPAKSNQLVLHQGHLYIKTEDAIYDILGNKQKSFLR